MTLARVQHSWLTGYKYGTPSDKCRDLFFLAFLQLKPRASFLSFSLSLCRAHFNSSFSPFFLFFLFSPRLEPNRTPDLVRKRQRFLLTSFTVCYMRYTAQTSHELDDTRMTLNLTDINKRRRFHRPFRPSKKTEKAVICGEREREKDRERKREREEHTDIRTLVKRLANGEQTLRNTLPPLPLNFLVNAFLTSV